MASVETKRRSRVAVLAGLLLVLVGFAVPASAAKARTATLTATPTLQYAGSAVTFKGKVTVTPKGGVVKLQRSTTGRTWVAAGQTRTTTKAGAYSLKLNLPTTAATYFYRTLAPKYGRVGGVYSRTVAVTALRKTTTTFNVSPAEVPQGGTVTATGAVAPFNTGTLVSIQRFDGTTWVTEATTSVAANGSYTKDFSPSATGSFRAAASRSGVNAGSQSGAKTITVGAPAAPPTITTTSLTDGDKGLPYSATLTKAGGDGTWSITAGALPAGLALAPATGAITGTPEAGGTATFTVKFTETATNLSASKQLSILVTPPPTITTSSLPDVTRGTPYSTTLAKTGKAGTWSITGLPSGLSIDASSGTISGTTAAAAGTYGVYPVFTETAGGRQVLKPLALEVVEPAAGPVITTTSLPDGDKGLPYSATLTKTGAAGTWSIVGSLPAGLALNADTGAITGTPTAGGTVNFSAKYTETTSGLSSTKALSILVTPPPTITTESLPDATQGVAYSATLTKTGKAGTWSITGLPTGLTLNADTGAITGTTTVDAGTYGVYPTFTETAGGRQAFRPLALTVVDGSTPPVGPAITTTSLPGGTKDTAYTATLAKTGGDGTWSISAGTLPAGLSLAEATGVISGTPTAVGTSSFTVKFTETTGGAFATKPLSIAISTTAGGPAPTITTEELPDGTKGVAYSVTFTKTGQAGTWSSLELPAGLTLDPATGILSGTPTVSGNFSVWVGFSETESGKSATKGFALHIENSPVVTTTSVPDGTTGEAYSQQLAKTGQDGTWAHTAGNLPPGITLSASGLLAGTPTETGDYGFTVTFTETATGYADPQPLLLHISDPGAPSITTPNVLPDATVGTAYSTTLEATPTGGTWGFAYDALPAGLSLNPTTGVISGTPTTAGDAIFIVRYTQGGKSNTRAFLLQVAPAG